MTPSSRARQTAPAFRGDLTQNRGLALGRKGAKVLEMQTMLQAAGFDPGPLNGKLDPRMGKAAGLVTSLRD